ncbi:MAG: acyclic terpene utilization AtuA family protein, partial [Comamonas sp.]
MTSPTPHPTPLLIGCAAGFSGDRVDAAGPVVQELIRQAKPAVLIFETLAERTLALAQLARQSNPDSGFEPLMLDFLRPVLGDCLQHGIRIVSNFGAANPAGAARAIARLAQELGLRAPRIAVVHGDDLSAPAQRPLLQNALAEHMPSQPLVSANAYIGARPIA